MIEPLIILILVAIVVWLITTYVPMPDALRIALWVVAALIILIGLLRVVGVVS